MHPGEAGALLHDLLVSVTNFFRDRESFQALEARIPELFQDKTAADTIRVWVPACATGEEAYSIAMLLTEHARKLDAPPALQIFATDLDQDVLAEARNGLYPSTISTDVSPERLSRFFVKEHHGYRVRRELREILLFAVHDLLKDSPFSRLDLLSCRNLLIYLNRAAQKRAFDIFHFALRREGRLFLGTSESADDCTQLFQAVDKKQRLYIKRSSTRTSLPILSGPSTLARSRFGIVAK
jgi:two-component system CheB/CheR fusion protein